MTTPLRFLSSVLLFTSLALSAALGAPAKTFPVIQGMEEWDLETPPRIVRVTNLDGTGRGSLRDALWKKEPRVIVFDVAGVIDLEKRTLVVSNPYVVIAGQTAPEPGITLIRGGMMIQTHHVDMRHIKIRPGDAGQPQGSGWEPDGLCAYTSEAHDILIDHCSFTWAVDENVSVSGARTGAADTAHRITISNCIVAEGLNLSSHSKGAHSKGSLVHDFCQDILIARNLYASNERRNPFFKAHAEGVVLNNVIYNPGSAAIQLGFEPKEWANSSIEPINPKVTIIGNVLRHGQDTRESVPLAKSEGDVFMGDNLAFYREGTAQLTGGTLNILEDKPVWLEAPAGLEPLPAASVVDHVLANAGARPRFRDPIDQRIVDGVREDTGKILNSQSEVGGYPEVKATERKLEVPDGDTAKLVGWLQDLAAEVELP